jgi:hypothetical protein
MKLKTDLLIETLVIIGWLEAFIFFCLYGAACRRARKLESDVAYYMLRVEHEMRAKHEAEDRRDELLVQLLELEGMPRKKGT